jgi:DNA polymerase III delta prime subunit
MGCSGALNAIVAKSGVPIGKGTNVLDFCLEHFEPVLSKQDAARAAFYLHVIGLEPDDHLAAFCLVPRDATKPSQAFLARWGRMGVGPTNFMPIPSQVEDDGRPGIDVYGHVASNFNWRNCQWEVARVVDAKSLDIPSMEGDSIEMPFNAEGAWAFRDGVAVADLDALAAGEHPELGIVKEAEEGGASYLVRFGGRMWRRQPSADTAPQLLGFDSKSTVLQGTLDNVWGDIGGQDEAKRELIRAIQWPVLYPELFVLFKRRRSRGVLLYGPPGCGKTLLGKAVVKLIAALYHRKADDGGFKYVKGHQLLDQFVGNSEKAVKGLFDDSRRWREQRGYPAVLFFDEADALFKRRPSGGLENAFTLVPALLAEMDGMDESGAFVILATNRPDSLDLAITRPGRIDRRIRVTRPDQASAETIFRIHLDGVLLADGLTVDLLSAHAAETLFAPQRALYEVEFEEDVEAVPFLLKDLASGALVQNIVDRATANKMEFCIENQVREGLTLADLDRAIDEVFEEHRETRHNEELEEFADARSRRIARVRRAG